MQGWIEPENSHAATPLLLIDPSEFAGLKESLGERAANWCASHGFCGQANRFLALPGSDGGMELVLVGCDHDNPFYALSSLPLRLPEGDYALDIRGLQFDADQAALRWALGAYQFDRYRKPQRKPARLVVDEATRMRVAARVRAVCRVRDLVNTPTEDLGPAELASIVQKIAEVHDSEYREWKGDELAADFPAIHAVGRASPDARAPRLAMLAHGNEGAPHVVLVGKGVCFDTGGLDLKTADGMRWMKKDMGGAAHAIALAGLILDSELPLRLTLLIPAVENAVGGDAYRPGEIIRTRAGLAVEVDNTDAEGRLVLCDALAYASELKPDLIIDFATLTGAARVALGPDLPALFANRDDIADRMLASAQAAGDPLWRLPLWRPYLAMLESSIGDLTNSSSSRHAGAITAALFLERFLPESQVWCHFDTYAWNDSDRPGRPRGGEAQGLLACFEFLKQRYTQRA
ncbi:MAG: leucyl aminopeptidase family protein [Rhodanobacteraceae bacterium]